MYSYNILTPKSPTINNSKDSEEVSDRVAMFPVAFGTQTDLGASILPQVRGVFLPTFGISFLNIFFLRSFIFPSIRFFVDLIHVFLLS